MRGMSVKARLAGFTYEDYLLFPEDGRRHELIGGEHVVTPSPSQRHQRTSINLASALHAFVESSNLGSVFAAPFDVVLADSDVVQPDILFVSKAHAERVGERGVRGAPDLVVEITSESTRRTDEVVKRKLYEASGVAEYWVVDPEIETVKVYRERDGRFTRVAELSREDDGTLTSPLFPGLGIPLTAVFR